MADQEEIDKGKVDLVECVKNLANQSFEAASKIETTSRRLNEKMQFMISIGQMSMGFAHVLGTINGLSIGTVRMLQKLNKTTARILEDVYKDQVEVELAPKQDSVGVN